MELDREGGFIVFHRLSIHKRTESPIFSMTNDGHLHSNDQLKTIYYDPSDCHHHRPRPINPIKRFRHSHSTLLTIKATSWRVLYRMRISFLFLFRFGGNRLSNESPKSKFDSKNYSHDSNVHPRDTSVAP